MGGAQPLAVKMANGVFIGCDVDQNRIQKRIDSKYLDEYYGTDYDKALEELLKQKEKERGCVYRCFRKCL